MGLYWPQVWKKDTIKFGRPICNPWGQTTSQKCSKLAPSFLGPDSQCEAGISLVWGGKINNFIFSDGFLIFIYVLIKSWKLGILV
jgi:hypothetical protein